MNAIEFGEKHRSCFDAMDWRRSLPEDYTQSDAYLDCQRGDWLIWQLRRLPDKKYSKIRPALTRAMERIVSRAIRRGLRAIRGNKENWAKDYHAWARKWLSGEDRSASAYASAAYAPDAASDAYAASAYASAAYASDAASDAYAASAASASAAYASTAYASDAASDAAASASASDEAAYARKNELKLQARDIHREIPIWPGQ